MATSQIRPFRSLGEQQSGLVHAQPIQMLVGCPVVQPLRELNKPGDTHATPSSHFLDCPGFRQTIDVTGDIQPEQFHGSLRAAQRLVEGDILAAKHLQQSHEQFVEVHGQQRDGLAGAIASDGPACPHKTPDDRRAGVPDRLLGMADELSQFLAIVLGERDPGRPGPLLMRSTYADVDDQEMQTARRDVRITDAMRLPGSPMVK